MSRDWIDDLIKAHGRPYYGFDCPPGWRPIVEAFYAYVERYPCLQATQVKEKFGTLRLYWSHDFDCDKCDAVWGTYGVVIDAIESVSRFTCEQCGAYGTLRTGSWVRTLCDHCAGVRDAANATIEEGNL